MSGALLKFEFSNSNKSFYLRIQIKAFKFEYYLFEFNGLIQIKSVIRMVFFQKDHSHQQVPASIVSLQPSMTRYFHFILFCLQYSLLLFMYDIFHLVKNMMSMMMMVMEDNDDAV